MSGSLRRLARWSSGLRRMTWQERRCLVAALGLNPTVRWLLLHRGTSAAVGFVHRSSDRAFRARQRPVDADVVRAAKRVGAVVNRAAQEPAPAVTCLARSLTAQLLLRRVGTPAELCIGVRPAGPDDPAPSGESALLFHAWVEVEGIPINDVLDVAAQHAVFPIDGLSSFLRAVR